MPKRNGFTLIELIIVIIILGIVSVIAVPKVTGLLKEAEEAVFKGVVSGIKSGLRIAHAAWLSSYDPATGKVPGYDNINTWTAGGYPWALDNVPSYYRPNPSRPYFTYVMKPGITDPKWGKTASNFYLYEKIVNWNQDSVDRSITYDNYSGQIQVQ